MIVTFLFIALIVAIILIIGLVIQNVLISRKYDECKQENNRLNELLARPLPTIKAFVTNCKIQSFCIKRIIPAEEARFYGEKYMEFTKKQMAKELVESLALDGFVEFTNEEEPGMGEMLTARIDVVQKDGKYSALQL